MGAGGGSPWQGGFLDRGEGVSLAGGSPWQADPPVNRITDACETITLPQTSFAGGNNMNYLQNNHCIISNNTHDLEADF